MSKFNVTVNINICECNENKQLGSKKLNDGTFTMTISEDDAISIDNCEKAVLQTAYPAIRESVSKHLSEVSKKKFLKLQDRAK